jgi:hypothetical protein
VQGRSAGVCVCRQEVEEAQKVEEAKERTPSCDKIRSARAVLSMQDGVRKSHNPSVKTTQNGPIATDSSVIAAA